METLSVTHFTNGFIILIQMVILYVQSATDKRIDRIEEGINTHFNQKKVPQ